MKSLHPNIPSCTILVERRDLLGVAVLAPVSVALPVVSGCANIKSAANNNTAPYDPNPPATPRAGLTATNQNEYPPKPTAPAAMSWVRKYPQLEYQNQSATRNLLCTEVLERGLIFAACAVYGADVVIEIYSGGQPAKGTSDKRTGTIRHDDQGYGGRAADIRVRRSNGTLIAGPELARMGQYWLAAGWGGVGFEMNQNGTGGGGLHLDEWVRPPPGGGMLWYYSDARKTARASGAMGILESGLGGIYPR